MKMLKSEQQLEQDAEAKIGFLSDGFWYCTDGQRFYSRRMAVTVQIEIDHAETIKANSNPD
jgi:hypothetical protein